ncbi:MULTISPECIES: hypothetical protein [Clostridium]|uniref:Plasmodium RESA N-terminal domain-containing protein n=2 Tax=Clostridium TaxID=1485 RepID=D8GRK1_CLOLD|nr:MULTISPECIES: hypothetical protein [Clostridium]ADK16369.1 hypothetical protein CLJU_c33230 [Clostridium ljungdahlii DSM 13528]AGY75447.1 hypothetical protein CAETHG_1222 [Clostridium autoethanogenum DSM 10061]ALU35613.1 Hypothetical protein CLAU_1184 [Clostridium autoethanogenum DSM 10061]OAA89756.1 hypothetical protein WX45_01593 [Clostridium ljungdahlii DSM 13528]OVY52325.1 hypothetical protein WX72_01222 [Clostridium autoethanogenum]
MDSITISKLISCKAKCNVSEHKTSSSNNNTTNFKGKDDSNISKDGTVLCNFFNRIESSSKDNAKLSSLSKYTSEYKKIKKEILSGAYGSDTQKYMSLLDNAFKDTLNNFSNSLIKSLTKNIAKNTTKMSYSSLIKFQKQYETGTTLTWMFREENKEVLRKIDYYKRKKIAKW